jgi:hypothetical protein
MSITASHPITVETDRYLAAVTAAATLGYGNAHPHLNEDFLIQLGCCYWSPTTWKIEYPRLADEDRVFAQEALPRLMELVNIVGPRNVHVADVRALVTALHDAGRWRDCLASVESAYGLAVSICLVIEDIAEQEDTEADTPATPQAVFAILKDWLDPEDEWLNHDVEWVVLPNVIKVAERLFGSAWCHVAVGEDAGAADFCALIGRDRPPFLPGLCHAQEVDQSVDLPLGVG